MAWTPYTLAESPPLALRRKLELLLVARDRMRAAYLAFCSDPTRRNWEAYTVASEEVLMADGQAYGTIAEHSPPARRAVWPIAGRLMWLSLPSGNGRPCIIDAFEEGTQTCPNCHGAAKNVYLFRDDIAREATCFCCKGAGAMPMPAPVALKGVLP